MRLVALALLLALAPAVYARSLAGYDFPETLVVGERTLSLNGVGLRLATLFRVEVYAAGLYLERKDASAEDIIARDDAWRLVMRFIRDVDRHELEASIRDAFDRNGLQHLAAEVDLLTGSITGVRQGDEVRLTYVPGEGTGVVWAGRVGETIPGARFARGLLSCWIGARPPNPELRDGLLGG